MKLKVKNLTSVLEKTIGLLNFNKPIPVFFKTRFGIHTFGMKYPIDILILDNKDIVVKLTKNLNPNRIFIWNPKFYKVIELPSEFIDDKQIKIGDKLDLEFE